MFGAMVLVVRDRIAPKHSLILSVGPTTRAIPVSNIITWLPKQVLTKKTIYKVETIFLAVLWFNVSMIWQEAFPYFCSFMILFYGLFL